MSDDEGEPLSEKALAFDRDLDHGLDQGSLTASGVLVGPMRRALSEEFHRREPAPILSNAACSSIAFPCAVDDDADAWSLLNSLCTELKIDPPDLSAREFLGFAENLRFKWERHTEFVVYTFYADDVSLGPFEQTAFEKAPVAWRAKLKEKLLAAVHIALVQDATQNAEAPVCPSGLFESERVAGGVVCDGRAALWSDFQFGPDGFSRILVLDLGLTRHRAGRLVQRLIDMEIYRLVAMLGLQRAHAANARAVAFENDLHILMDDPGFAGSQIPDFDLLNKLLLLASQVEDLLSNSSFRFDATSAYAKIFLRRLDELDEQRIQGAQRLSNFLKRRFVPAMDTCESTAARLNSLATRIHRDAALIRTRIDLSRQEQNGQLLEAINHRAHQQFKLQQTVEALSTVAISYYSIGIFSTFAKAIHAAWPAIDTAVLVGVFAPIIIAGVYLTIRRVRKVSEAH